MQSNGNSLHHTQLSVDTNHFGNLVLPSKLEHVHILPWRNSNSRYIEKFLKVCTKTHRQEKCT